MNEDIREISAKYPLEGNYEADARYNWPKRWEVIEVEYTDLQNKIKQLEEIEWLKGGSLCGGVLGCYICGNLKSEGHKIDCKLNQVLSGSKI